VDGPFELAVLLFNIAVLVRHAEVVGRGLQSVIHHQQSVALLGLRPPIGIQQIDGRAQVIGAVLAGYADDMRVIRPGSVVPHEDQNFGRRRRWVGAMGAEGSAPPPYLWCAR
jgi:hypothetical protein